MLRELAVLAGRESGRGSVSLDVTSSGSHEECAHDITVAASYLNTPPSSLAVDLPPPF